MRETHDRPRPATTDAAIARLWQAIDERQEELVVLIGDLVRIPSLLGDESAIQAAVADHLATTGFATESCELDESIKAKPNAGDSGVPFAGRPNVAGVLAGAGSGRSLIVNGHVDVVSPEPVTAWSHDPWGAEIAGDRMYGRGAYDMKSGVGLNLWLPRLLQELGLRLRGDLIVHSVIEEECTGNGALAASLRHQADAAVVTEPTGGALTSAHVGVLWFRIAIEGVSWHAMQAYRGVNAITKAVPVIHALQALDRELNEQPPHPAFADVEHPINLNIGVIQGGDWPSTVPGACDLRCRLAVYPGQSVADAHRAIEAAVAAAAANDPWLREHPPTVSYDGFQSAGSEVALDAPSIRCLGHWHERVTGSPMQSQVGTGINDMRYYNFAGMPAGCYGAGGGNAHGADEWLDLPSLVPAAKVLGAFILDWCGIAENEA